MSPSEEVFLLLSQVNDSCDGVALAARIQELVKDGHISVEDATRLWESP